MRDKNIQTPDRRSSMVFLEEAHKIEGLKFSTEAMKACGMQPELAAHLIQQNHAMGVSTILRAGSPPVYNQKRGPKTGFNLSKTSNQGFFKGSLAAETRFARTVDILSNPSDPESPKVKHGQSHHAKDAAHLALSNHDPDYLHTVPLTITMQDILREIGENGDLRVLGYDQKTGELRLAYHENKGDADFKGQFVVNLKQGSAEQIFYSRPWDRPDHDPNWDPEAGIIKQPEALAAIPMEVYHASFNHLFTVNYTEQQIENPAPHEIKPAKVFSNTPRTSEDLRAAILNSEILDPSSETYQVIQHMTAGTPRKKILALLTEEQINAVYDSCALITTGDWDGLALGQPPSLTQNFPHPEKLRVYNTFDSYNGPAEKEGLVEASCNYFDYLKTLPEIKNTGLGILLNSVNDPIALFSEFTIDRAGCITPHEFLYQQLINYAYRDQVNVAYGNQKGRDAMQAGMDAALIFAKENPKENFQTCTKIALTKYEQTMGAESNITWKTMDTEHLLKHLEIALKNPSKPYIIPNISHDHNVHDLFQHGFDMRNPYGSNLEGAWLMVTNEGNIIYGKTQEQLVEVLLIPGFLENNVITVSHGADMSAGWDRVIKRQIDLGQEVSDKTLEKYNQHEVAKKSPGLMKSMKTTLEQFKREQFKIKDRPEEPLEQHDTRSLGH